MAIGNLDPSLEWNPFSDSEFGKAERLDGELDSAFYQALVETLWVLQRGCQIDVSGTGGEFVDPRTFELRLDLQDRAGVVPLLSGPEACDDSSHGGMYATSSRDFPVVELCPCTCQHLRRVLNMRLSYDCF